MNDTIKETYLERKMKESKCLEFKSAITISFLKTVSAYSNFGDGEILFGVNDDGSVCGMDHLEMFGTGVRRILLAYNNAKVKPKFEITDHVISVILPVIKYEIEEAQEDWSIEDRTDFEVLSFLVL